MRVLSDRAIRGEAANPCDVENRTLSPYRRCAPSALDVTLSFDVAAIVCQHQEGIVVEQVVRQRREEMRLIRREVSALDELDCACELGISLDPIAWPIAATLVVRDLFGSQTE